MRRTHTSPSSLKPLWQQHPFLPWLWLSPWFLQLSSHDAQYRIFLHGASCPHCLHCPWSGPCYLNHPQVIFLKLVYGQVTSKYQACRLSPVPSPRPSSEALFPEMPSTVLPGGQRCALRGREMFPVLEFWPRAGTVTCLLCECLGTSMIQIKLLTTYTTTQFLWFFCIKYINDT